MEIYTQVFESGAGAAPFLIGALVANVARYQKTAVSLLAFSVFHAATTLTFCILKTKNFKITALIKEKAHLIKVECPLVSVGLLVASIAIAYFSFPVQLALAGLGAIIDGALLKDALKKVELKVMGEKNNMPALSI